MRKSSFQNHLRFAILVLFLASLTVGSAQQNQDEAAKANALYAQNQRLEALPLYEELAKAHPNEWLYQERLMDCLLTKRSLSSDPAERKTIAIRAKEAATRAIALGDKNAISEKIAQMNPEEWENTPPPQTPAQKLLDEGEKAFAANDIPKAIKKYQQAAEADPNLYLAPLFLGDMAYRQKDLPTAAKWFTRAIEINPNIETAYRYWGDAILVLGNDPDASKDKFIDAIIADPYNRMSWQGLQNYASRQNVILSSPKIDRPAGPVVDPKNPNNITINVDPTTIDGKKNPGSAAWMMYSLMRANYRNNQFKKEFPNETTYRHSLKEESAALSGVATVLGETKVVKEKLNESLRNLVELHKAGMLDCWILVNGADQGIAQDYDAYRKDHRQLLHDYIDRFILHGVGAATRQ